MPVIVGKHIALARKKGTSAFLPALSWACRNTAIQTVVGTIIAALLPGLTFGRMAGAGSGSVCIAPVLEKPILGSAPGLFCESQKLSLRIDTHETVPWPVIPELHENYQIGNGLKIDALGTATRHRVVVFCNGKPQQSFTFRFSDFESGQLCLFLNDLYKTAQLWEAKRCPWCKCK